MNLTFSCLGSYEKNLLEIINLLDRERVPQRIWKKDYTLWASKPDEITNRLGWLDIISTMRGKLVELNTFSSEIQKDGIRDVILLGMGGSSLGSEVLNQALGSMEGHPRLIVLDSTIPETIDSVLKLIEPLRALFLVSSKSGTTAETSALFDYFYSTESGADVTNRGRHFAAITDSGTPLENLAREKNFRGVFCNPEDIGGRYSVLSLFGLVPAAIIGINVSLLLDSADIMRERCSPDIKIEQNEGCRLGAYLGAMAKQGKDKVTIITSPMLDSFGVWVEQLIAESTGKNGLGLVPVTGEPFVDANLYDSDRQFLYLRLKDDNNSNHDSFIKELIAAGHPLAVLEMESKMELGALLYLWEFAVSVAGALIGIHPFDQPDVENSKNATRRILDQYKNSGRLPVVNGGKSIPELLSQANSGDYLAIMAYIEETNGSDKVFNMFRRSVIQKYKLATTLGYGPRFLHSTGQLHKGGPNKGLFLQIISNRYKDIPIPGRHYSFGIMSNAESMGDLQALQALSRRVVRMEVDPAKIEDFLII